jgi:tetratricopeptide (TPR) repeat protein
MKKLVLVLLFLFMGRIQATTYYIDNSAANDNGSGTTPATAWKTINKANSGPIGGYTSNDIIRFKCGQTWQETLIPPSNYLTFTYYGPGAKPIIDGQSSRECVNLDPNETENNPRSNLTFIGLKFVNGYPNNIELWNCPYTTIDSCNCDYSKGNNILNSGIYAGPLSSHLVVRNSTISYGEQGNIDDEGNLGVYIDGADDCLIEHDTLIGNFSNIRIGFGTYNTDAEDHIHNWTDGLIVRYCIVKNGKWDNVDDDGSYGAQLYYNVFESGVGTLYHVNIYMYSDGTGDYPMFAPQNGVYYNNSFIQRGGNVIFSVSPSAIIQTRGMQFDNNIIYNENGSVYWEDITPWTNFSVFFNHNIYSTDGTWRLHNVDKTFAQWKTAGFDTSSRVSDPILTDYDHSDYTLQSSSPATLSGTWVGLNAPLNHDIDGNLIGDPPDLGAYQKSFYKAGTITVDTTYSGSIGIVGDLALSYGKTLTISPGTHFKVKNDANITLHGILLSQYNSQMGDITFSPLEKYGHWGSIIFDEESFSTSTLQHSTLTNSTGIQCLNGANVNIEHTTIDSSIQGIYIYNSQANINDNFITNPESYGIFGEASGQNINIDRNTITRTLDPEYEALGICLSDYTSVHLTNNYISGFYWGAFMMVETNLETGLNYEADCNNVITGNVYGLGTYGNCTTFAGGYVGNDLVGAFNGIYGNTNYDIYTAVSSSFQGYSDYFGADTNFYADNSSTNDIQDILSSDPCGTSKKIDNGNVISNSSLKQSGKENLLEGLLLEKQDRIDEAIEYYKGLISSDSHVIYAITRLAVIRNNYSRPELIAYIESLLNTSNQYYCKIKNLLGSIYFQENRFQDGIAAFNNVIDRPTQVYDGINARFGKLFGYLNIRNDVQSASQILKEIKAMDPADRNTLIKIKAAERLLEGGNRMNKIFASTNGDIPKEYGLSQNYPNPFNPSTTIRYQIPKSGIVTLKVYDILGKEVATLVNENKIKGSYEINFIASKFASGVYIYQLRANDYVASKKMIMIK